MAKCYFYWTITVLFYLLVSLSAAPVVYRSMFGRLPIVLKPPTLMSGFLNVTADQVSGNQTSLNPEDLRVLFYKGDGSFTVYSLSSDCIPLDPNQDIKIIIHGFNAEATANWTREMALTYHKIGKTNTLAIDWYVGANKGYLRATLLSKVVGPYVADWLYYQLLHGNSTRLEKVHIIGHSLGAHIAGFIGKRIFKITGGQHLIGKIAGLDAASMLFEIPVTLPSDWRLNDKDAIIVEGYHTSAGFLGFVEAYGHRDFYITNGGPIQPECVNGFHIIDSLKCSHSFAHEIYRKSIESKDYVATKCLSFLNLINFCDEDVKIIMGENTNATNERGSFFL